jgi:hypothetical protein
MTTTAGMRRGPRFSPVGVAFGVDESRVYTRRNRGEEKRTRNLSCLLLPCRSLWAFGSAADCNLTPQLASIVESQGSGRRGPRTRAPVERKAKGYGLAILV